MRLCTLSAFAALAMSPCVAAARAPGETPAGALPTRINERGTTVLPSGRLITPRGRSFRVAPHPFGLALSPDGKTLASASSGTGPFCVTLIDRFNAPRLRQIPADAAGEKEVPSVFMGLAFSRDSRTLFVAGGDNGAVYLLDVSSGKTLAAISCNDAANPESYTGDLVLSPDGRTLYVADQAHFRVAVIDVPGRKLAGSVRVGRHPFALALSPDGKRLWVANVGTYEYKPIEGGLPFPPFGVPSREAEVGVTVDGKRVPGLGSPNVAEALSVWGIDVSRPAVPKVVRRVKTGTLVGAAASGGIAAVGGAGPNALVATADRVYVSNGGNDTVQAIDARSGRIVATIALGPAAGRKAKGAAPFGLALSPDGRRLYVAEAGINAVGVIDVRKNRVIGHIPAGWYPSRVRVSSDGKTLYVTNAKGFGSGPSGGKEFNPGPGGSSYIGSLMKGTVSIMPAPSDASLPGLTRQVLANNGFPGTPAPANLAALRKAVQYVVYITKENRTFDEVFGDVPGVRGDPALARYGVSAEVSAPGQPTLTGINVMPNHRALALRYGLCDNFHADGDVSADGHRWLVGVYPNEWTETQVAASYGGKGRFSMTAPGRRAFFGSDASSIPEDYPEAGSLFDHLARNGVSFRNYGEGFEFAGVAEDPGSEPTGARESLNFPMTRPLYENTSREFPIFNMNIPDQFRADQFLKDVERWRTGAEEMPRFVNIALPNDHGSGLDAASGYPYTASYMGDNDYALGRIVEALSHTRYWPKMVIFITEDDAQGGVDHVDAHRTVLIAAGPPVKRGYISHRHGSLPSVVHTINRLFGLPDLNQFDATASDLTDFLQASPDAEPYTAIRPDARVFDPSKAMARYGKSSVRRDDPAFLQEQQQQAIERR